MSPSCPNCKPGKLCRKHQLMLNSFRENAPKVSTHFSGPSPPEVFVGRIGYPHINSGILAPTTFDTRLDLNNAEDWSRENLGIANVLRLRARLVYGRGKSHIKKQTEVSKITRELAMTHKPTATEFFLKKKPIVSLTSSSIFRPMTNAAPIKKVLLEENTKVLKKVDYIVDDIHCKAVEGLRELYSSKLGVDHLQKLLSTGLLGKKIDRRMVPTRWSITAVDDTLSKQMLDRIRYNKEVDSIRLFSGTFVGNYVEVLFLPGRWSFEAIEAWDSSELDHSTEFSSDFEGFYNRKKYAFNVTGGYYAMRLPVCEWLDNMQLQGTVLVFRRITKEYYAPLGVGVVREATRRAMNGEFKEFESINEALIDMKERIGFSPDLIKEKSWILKEYGKQKRLSEF
jgi:DNA repair protein NreA